MLLLTFYLDISYRDSVIKRKFGDAIRSRKRSLQRREPLVKGLLYNLYV